MAVTPPPDVIDGLRPNRASVVHHEAGHALVAALHDLPIKHLEVGYAKGGLFTTWYTVTGVLRMTHDTDDNPLEQALTGAAGVIAEAVHRRAVDGGRLPARIKEARRRNNDVEGLNDKKLVAKYARLAGLSDDKVFERALPLVLDRWSTVEDLAAELDATGKLDARRIRRVVGV
ncbi:hypothetical protein [Saccharothrix sp. HUAS TT1]|uniref:hypothetical protein n=1 Tax=unclassified Saccharothrix TaxID=2593673 RepID=UPI00345C358F